MKLNINKIALVLILSYGSAEIVHGKEKVTDKPRIEIVPCGNASHIARSTGDSLVVVSGKTQLFTVDTQENAGIISTCPEADQLLSEIHSDDGVSQIYHVIGINGIEKHAELIERGDKLLITSPDGTKAYKSIVVKQMALCGKLVLPKAKITQGSTRNFSIQFCAGQRGPNAMVEIFIPDEVNFSKTNVLVNVAGRGFVKLEDLSTQTIGRVGSDYSYTKVGTYEFRPESGKGIWIIFSQLDLRPSNGTDIELILKNASFSKAGKFEFKSKYSVDQPEKLASPGFETENATLEVRPNICDFERIAIHNTPYRETPETYTSAQFRWTPLPEYSSLILEFSTDSGNSWAPLQKEIMGKTGFANIAGLKENTDYLFRLHVTSGIHRGYSNTAELYTGKTDVRKFGAKADGQHDDTEAVNSAIKQLSLTGGGTLLFRNGIFPVRTIHLESNVFIYVDKSAVIKALKGLDAPESAWFSDKKYRSGLSPTDAGPYVDPENFTTKQDVGHTYFRNAMFFGERLDNVKIVGNGRITGDGNLNTSDKVMNNEAGNRADKMFSLKLCTNVEIGGISRNEDLWYDAEAGEPFYIRNDQTKDFDCGNMLHIDRGGHFVLLATGTDSIQMHDIYQGQNSSSNVRDIFDFMGCNEVTVNNIYCRVSSDDIVKLGSDCSLGFTRTAKNYKIRNIIGDTNCNLFQIGSETADDITNVAVDNIYVLGANKAGFSISTNDGGHIRNVRLNSGRTGPIRFRSKMYRTTTPFFISISNRGRILGSHVARYKFTENGVHHDELLCTDVNIGEVENIHLNGVDCSEVYSGSSFRSDRWKAYDGSQRKATPIVAGYKLPDSGAVEGGLNFRLPNGKHTGYITNITFDDVHVLVKGGNPLADSEKTPPELGVGQYNVSNLGIQPAYGLWVRHAQALKVENCTFNYEKEDGRYAIFLDDVQGATIDSVKMVKAQQNAQVVKLFGSNHVSILNSVFYRSEWGKSPVRLPRIKGLKGEAGVPL